MPTVFVTGASRGLGLEFVRQYRADGWDVIAACRKPKDATDLASIGGIDVVALDVTDPRTIANTAQRYGGRAIDLLINNAGIYGPRGQGVGHVDKPAWAEVLRVNVLGQVAVTEALLPNILASEHRKIVAITSKMGSIADNTSGGEIIYRSSKAALNMAFRSVALDLAGKSVTVGLLHPGWVRTAMGGPSAPLPPEVSVAGMRKVIATLSLAHTGRFLNYDGTEIPW